MDIWHDPAELLPHLDWRSLASRQVEDWEGGVIGLASVEEGNLPSHAIAWTWRGNIMSLGITNSSTPGWSLGMLEGLFHKKKKKKKNSMLIND